MDSALIRSLQPQIEALKVLIVDDDHYMRKVVRAMLAALGVKTVFEANDGVSGLDAIRQNNPDLIIVDWEMPMIDGAQFVRMIRSPGDFPRPDVPIIMLSGHGDRWRVVEAARIGAHEYLLKPVSTKALHDRIVAVLGRPRPFVQTNGYFGPAPRRPVPPKEIKPSLAQPAAPSAAKVSQPKPAPENSRWARPTPVAAPAARPTPHAPQPAGAVRDSAAEPRKSFGRRSGNIVFVN